MCYPNTVTMTKNINYNFTMSDTHVENSFSIGFFNSDTKLHVWVVLYYTSKCAVLIQLHFLCFQTDNMIISVANCILNCSSKNRRDREMFLMMVET